MKKPTINLNKESLTKYGLVLILLIIALPFLLGICLPVINRILGAPNLSILEDYQPIGSIEIYDYKDNFVGVLQGKEDRQVVKLSQISDYAKLIFYKARAINSNFLTY